MKFLRLLIIIFFIANNLIAEEFLNHPLLFSRDKISTQRIEGSDRFVSSKSGLNLREDPFTTSRILVSIPYYAKVKFLDNTEVFNYIGNKKGRWVKIKYKNQIGYVFDGFLKDIRMFIEGHGFWWGNVFAGGEIPSYYAQCLYFGKQGDVYYFESGDGGGGGLSGVGDFYISLFVGRLSYEKNRIKIVFYGSKNYFENEKIIKFVKWDKEIKTEFNGLYYATPKKTFFGVQSIHFCKKVLKKKRGLDNIWVRNKKNFISKGRDSMGRVLQKMGVNL